MNSATRWEGDKLGRHKFGDFLYTFLTNRHQAQKSNISICCALDGEWGVGKTFFVDRWIADTIGKQHIAIKYDAWKNDHHDDALMNFIAHINEEIKPVIGQIPMTQRARGKIQTAFKGALKNAAKATLPIGVGIAKNLGKRYIGSEGMDAVKNIIADPSELVSDKDIDNFLEATFKSHKTKSDSIAKVKAALENLAENIDSLDGIQGPIFIIIDELDRCRPNYAISLLEGIKHILNAKGICFIISTNLNQLSESVKALYGSNFDSRRYLRRFFDYEFELPEGHTLPLIESLLENSPISDQNRCVSGLSNMEIHSSNNIHISISKSIFHVTELFEIDLRSINQIISRMEAFLASSPIEEKINITYLCTLCCIDMKGDGNLKAVVQNKTKKLTEFITPTRNERKYVYSFHDMQGNLTSVEQSLTDIIKKYIDNTTRNPENIQQTIRHHNIYDRFSFQLRQDVTKNNIADYHKRLKRMPTVQSGEYPE